MAFGGIKSDSCRRGLSGGLWARLGDLRQVVRQRARCADSGRPRTSLRTARLDQMPKFDQRTNQRFWQGLASNGRGTNQFPAAASPGIAMAKSVLAVSAPVTKASAAASISTVRGPEPRLCASWRAPFARRSRRSMYPHPAHRHRWRCGRGSLIRSARDRGIVLLSRRPSR